MQHNETAHLQSEFDMVHTEQSTEIGFESFFFFLISKKIL